MKVGDIVVVFGVGLIGLFVIEVLKVFGVFDIYVVELFEECKVKVEEFGVIVIDLI